MRSLPTIHLYSDPSSPNLDLCAVAGYLRETLGVAPDLRGEFLQTTARGEPQDMALDLAQLKVRDPDRPHQPVEPLYGELQFELRGLKDPSAVVPGIPYDGWGFMELLRRHLPPSETGLGHLHLILTPRLLATFDEDDRRYHARTILLGYPCIISTSGLVEAPAKPREFYILKQRVASLSGSVPMEMLKQNFQGEFLDYGDERLTEVVKGYALQSVLYYAAGESFCNDPDCRLFNAHWQRDLLRAQVASGRLCRRHGDIAEGLFKASAERPSGPERFGSRLPDSEAL